MCMFMFSVKGHACVSNAHMYAQSCGSRGQLQVLFLRLHQPLVCVFLTWVFGGYHTQILGLARQLLYRLSCLFSHCFCLFVCLLGGSCLTVELSLGSTSQQECVNDWWLSPHLHDPDWPYGTAARRPEARVGISLRGYRDMKSSFWSKSSVQRINGEKCHSSLSVQWKASKHHHHQQQNTAEPIVRQEARAHSGLAAPGQAAGGAGGVIRSHMPSPSECPLCGGPGNFLLQKSIQTGFCLSVWAGWVLERSNTM